MNIEEVILESSDNAYVYDRYENFKILQAIIDANDGKFYDKFYVPVTTLANNSTLVEDVMSEIKHLEKRYPKFSFKFSKFV